MRRHTARRGVPLMRSAEQEGKACRAFLPGMSGLGSYEPPPCSERRMTSRIPSDNRPE